MCLGNLLLVGVLEGFVDVWGVSYLTNIFSFKKSDAATVISCIFIGMIFGAPLLAIIAEKMNANYALTALSGFVMSAALFAGLFLEKYLSMNLLYLLCF